LARAEVGRAERRPALAIGRDRSTGSHAIIHSRREPFKDAIKIGAGIGNEPLS
jgi:hypothetical protein